MSKNQAKELPIQNHKVITRRDFIAQGGISSLGFVVAPTVLSMLTSIDARAQAACPSSAPVAGKMPVIIFDLAGGANIAGGDVIVGKAGGQLDFLGADKYQSLGQPNDQHPSLPGQMTTVNGAAAGAGLAFHTNSDILRGMRTTGMAALPNVDGIIFAGASGDDTGNNPHNPIYWLNKAGATGSIANIVGRSNSDSGGNAVAPAMSYNPAVRSVQVLNPAAARGLVQLGVVSTLFTTGGLTNNAKLKKIIEAAEMTSGRKIASFNSLDLSSQIKELVNCGFIDAKDLAGRFSQTAVDPASDAMVTQSFANLANNSDQQATASIAKLILDGYAGAGTVTIGGCDYHGNGRQSQAQKNNSVGELIGSVFNLARLKNKDIAVIVYSDGGVSSGITVDNTAEGKGRFDFTSDSGQRSAAVMMVYKRDGAPMLTDNTRQVGAYSDNGSVERTANQISDNVVNLSKAFVANYLALHGEEGKLAQVVGTESLSGEMGKYVKFRKIR